MDNTKYARFEQSAVKLLDDVFADLDLRARAIGDVKNGKAILDLSNGLVIRYYDLKEDIAAAPKAEQQAEPVRSFEQRLEAAKAFLARSSDAGMEKLLPYDVQPLIRELAALIGQWQRDASGYPEAPKVDGPECGQAEPVGEIREIDHQHVPVWSNGTPEPGTKLYAHPPAQQQLSDAEILSIADRESVGILDEIAGTLNVFLQQGTDVSHVVVNFARSIERALLKGGTE